MSVAGRVAIVTGAGTAGGGVGVGKAVSVVLAQQGAKLVLVDLDKEQVAETQALVAKEGGESIVCIADITDPAECQRIVDEAVAAFGTVDILVNNAAASIPGTVVSLSDSDWTRVYDVILMGTVRMSRSAVPVMETQQRGSIINISSIASTISMMTAAYGSAKGAIEALTRDMAVTHGRAGVRVNAIVPGYLNTPRVVRGAKAAKSQQAQRAVLTDLSMRNAANPLGIEGNAWDVAWAVEYFASDRARFVTGVSLPVDGGVLVSSYLTMASIIQNEGG